MQAAICVFGASSKIHNPLSLTRATSTLINESRKYINCPSQRQCQRQRRQRREQRRIFSFFPSLLSSSSSSPSSLTLSSLPSPSPLPLPISVHRYPRHYRYQQRRNAVFVSKHNRSLRVTASDIRERCTSSGIPSSHLRETRSHITLRECPFCLKPTNDQPDNEHKLYVQLGGGAFFCHRCGSKGSWYDFRMKLGGFEVVDSGGGGLSSNSGGWKGGTGSSDGSNGNGHDRGDGSNDGRKRNVDLGRYNTNNPGNHDDQANHGARSIMEGNDPNPPCLPMPPKKLNSIYTTNLLDYPEWYGDATPVVNSDSEPEMNSDSEPKLHNDLLPPIGDERDRYEALKYLTEVRGFTKRTMRKYGVGLGAYSFRSTDPAKKGRYERAACITFPWIMRAAEIEEQEGLRGGVYNWREEEKKKEEEREREKEKRKDKEEDEGMVTRKVSATAILETKNQGDDGKEDDGNEGENNGFVDANASEITTVSSSSLRDKTHERLGPFMVRRIKARALSQKSWQKMDPPGGGHGFFGWHTVPLSATEVVLTEGEYDAMAVHQATGMPAISLPNGCRSLPVDLLPLLERFERVYLWMDDDTPGREGAEKFAKKIGVGRCMIVRPTADTVPITTIDTTNEKTDTKVIETQDDGVAPPKDANDALLRGFDLTKMIHSAGPIPHERILTFADMRAQVLYEVMNPDRFLGVPVPSLPQFTSIIKGFRRGEMTVLTGPTGSGKTTFLGQLSLDFAEQGVNTLWGSFEIKNHRLVLKLLRQYSRGPLDGVTEDIHGQDTSSGVASPALHALADRFETLPLYFLKFHGGSDIDDVLDAMDYAAYVYDVEHIILDNLQFMISRKENNVSSSFTKFDVQDAAVDKFRKFATDLNVHVTLVVHPRKEMEFAKLGMNSIYGGAKASQEADTVLILQHDGTNKVVEVKKNRFDGTLGQSPLFFRKESERYYEHSELMTVGDADGQGTRSNLTSFANQRVNR